MDYQAESKTIRIVREVFVEVGRDVPVPTEVLAARAGTSERQVKAAIACLVERGMTIISTRQRSYVWTSDPTAISREVRRLMSHSIKTKRRAYALSGETASYVDVSWWCRED